MREQISHGLTSTSGQAAVRRGGSRHQYRCAGPAIALCLGSAFFGMPRATTAFGALSSMTDKPVLAVESPVGRLEYRIGRGLRVGKTGLNIGGFVTAEVTREEGKPGNVVLEGVNFLVLFEPTYFFRAFSEIELGRLFEIDSAGGGLSSHPSLQADRLYGDLGVSDQINVRLGKFLTPVGRWNPVPAEPFVWTTSEPLLAERPFDSHMTGAMVQGVFFPPAATFTYSFYAQFLDPLDPDRQPPSADRSAGMRLEYTTVLGERSVGASFLASERDGKWHHLGGLDAQWRTGLLELTGEVLITRGDLPEHDLWGAYLQGVYELVDTLYLVSRYEHFDPSGSEPTVNLADLGFAWIPLPHLRLKADYRVIDRRAADAAPGLRASLSLLF